MPGKEATIALCRAGTCAPVGLHRPAMITVARQGAHPVQASVFRRRHRRNTYGVWDLLGRSAAIWTGRQRIHERTIGLHAVIAVGYLAPARPQTRSTSTAQQDGVNGGRGATWGGRSGVGGKRGFWNCSGRGLPKNLI